MLMGQAITFVLGVLSFAHFTITQLVWGEIGWLIVGWLVLPVTALIWPAVAATFGLMAGGFALVFYLAVAGAMAIGYYEQMRWSA